MMQRQLAVWVAFMAIGVELGNSPAFATQDEQSKDATAAKTVDLEPSVLSRTESLFLAAKKGDLAEVQAALEAGVPVDSRSKYGATALIFAAEHGHAEVAKLLVDRGADLNAKDDFYKGSPYTWAALGGHRDLATYLKEKGSKASFDLGAGPTSTIAEVPTVSAEEAGASINEEMLLADQHFVSPNWPQFRGVGSRGLGDGQAIPLKWSVEEKVNVAWSTEIPGLGHSCPVIWDELVFLTTSVCEKADNSIRTGNYGDYLSVPETESHDFVVLAIERATGKIRWQRTARSGVPQVKRHLKSTHANPTCATNGHVVVAFFGSEGLYCYDFSGNLIWQKDLGFLDSGWFYDADYQWGFAASPVIHGEHVYLQCDIQKDSFIAAYRLSDGQESWRTARDEIPGWSSPTVCDTTSGPIVVTNGSRRVRGYDALTGQVLFEMGGNSEVVVPTPQFAYQTVFVTSGYKPIQPIYAIAPDSRGDISLAEDENSSRSVRWAIKRHGPYLPTPIVYRGYLYTLDNSGVVSCYEATSGKRVYRERIKGYGNLSFVGSPVAANGHIFAAAEDGQVIVIKAGPEFETVGANPCGDSILSSPAIAQGMFFVRTKTKLVAIQDQSTR